MLVGSAVGALGLIISVMIIRMCSNHLKKKKQKATTTFQTDENHVYGTYSRGSQEADSTGTQIKSKLLIQMTITDNKTLKVFNA